jgi:hypothetical protein
MTQIRTGDAAAEVRYVVSGTQIQASRSAGEEVM